MKFEIIEVVGGISLTASRAKFKVIHLRADGQTEQTFKPPEAIKYIEDYCTQHQLHIINVTSRKLGYTLFLTKEGRISEAG